MTDLEHISVINPDKDAAEIGDLSASRLMKAAANDALTHHFDATAAVTFSRQLWGNTDDPDEPEDRDDVDLDHLHAVDDALNVAHGRGPRLGFRVRESLSGHGDATCLRERQCPAGHVAEPRRWV